VNASYAATVRLLLAVAPTIFETPLFALKGGTALNLFVQDLPRLSIDIDVVFVRHDMTREVALQTIKDELSAAATRITRMGLDARVRPDKMGDEVKLFVTDGTSEVKVEVNHVFRGTALAPIRASLTTAAQALFAANIEVPMLAVPELYGSKLVAALDRQHPRDLFDIQYMFKRFGLATDFVDCFVAYLAGHNRPVHEVLFARPKPLAALFASEFAGMTAAPVALEALEATRTQLFESLPKALTPAHRAFLLSLVQAKPEWRQMPFAHLQELPAIRWKLSNLAKLKKTNSQRFSQQYDELAARLETVEV